MPQLLKLFLKKWERENRVQPRECADKNRRMSRMPNAGQIPNIGDGLKIVLVLDEFVGAVFGVKARFVEAITQYFGKRRRDFHLRRKTPAAI